jgi:hypothetical protein
MCQVVMAKRKIAFRKIAGGGTISKRGAVPLPGIWNDCPPFLLITLGDVRRENSDHEEQCKKYPLTPYVFLFYATVPVVTDEKVLPFLFKLSSQQHVGDCP